jgi:branched-chain amino acid transport system ATP-binding protein
LAKGDIILRIEDVHASYGNIHALKGVSLRVRRSEIVALLGANGSGKTTTLRVISGLLPATRGNIWFEDKPIVRRAPEKVVGRGISHAPEGRQVFGDLTVLENLRIGAFLRNDRRSIQDDIEWVFNLFPRLRERSQQTAQTLSGGEQQMLSIGRALMARPKLLLLDEPSLGLAPIIVDQIIETIKTINDAGTTILLVEQNSEIALSISNYAYVLETGRVTLEGVSATLLDNEQIKSAYFASGDIARDYR